MRLERGSRIEVWCEREAPSGAWRPAEVIIGNGHYYTVRFENGQVERVSRKVIRPSPPELGTNDLKVGDIVEFYDCFCWKAGKIILPEGEGYFLVSLLGSSLEFRVEKTDIRFRQSWQNDQWVVLKEAESHVEGLQFEDRSSMNISEARQSHNRRKGLRINLNLRTGRIYLKDNESAQEPRESFAKSKKRPNCQVEKYDGGAHKYRHALIESRATGAESVGSCSVDRNYVCNGVQRCRYLGRNGASDGYCSDAESSTEEDLKAEIHTLEMKAYRSILMAFRTAGPLTWEKEAMISDLRLYFNISNDEHLKELRRLVKGPLPR